MIKYLLIIILLLLAPYPSWAIQLEVPVKCTIGEECYIQHYVDADPGPRHSDYRCGSLSYQNSKGTDFRLPNYVDMDKGVEVIAAADGKVIGVREGISDINANDITDRSTLKGKECGNAVVIDHGNGYRTQYCHLYKGSTSVDEGEEVFTGQKLGLIGLSGDTNFPHLQFIVRYNGDYIDPFTARPMGSKCSPDVPQRSLWSEVAESQLPLITTTVLNLGFASQKPDAELARKGEYTTQVLSPETENVIFWADVMGIQAGDVLQLEILDENGAEFITHKKRFGAAKTQQFYFTGKRSAAGESWEPGIYSGRVILQRERNGRLVTVLRKTAELYIR